MRFRLPPMPWSPAFFCHLTGTHTPDWIEQIALGLHRPRCQHCHQTIPGRVIDQTEIGVTTTSDPNETW